MAQTKQIDKEATIQALIEWKNRSIGHGLNLEALNREMKKRNWQSTLKKVCKFAEIQPIYT